MTESHQPDASPGRPRPDPARCRNGHEVEPGTRCLACGRERQRRLYDRSHPTAAGYRERKAIAVAEKERLMACARDLPRGEERTALVRRAYHEMDLFNLNERFIRAARSVWPRAGSVEAIKQAAEAAMEDAMRDGGQGGD